MSSKLLVNVNDPNIPNTPDEPADAEPIVIPDTGGNTILDTKNISDNGVSMVLPIAGAVVLVVLVVSTIVVAAIRRRKVNRFSVHTSKHLFAKVASLSIVLLLGLFAIYNLNNDSNLVKALFKDGVNNTLSITAQDIAIDLDLEDDKVYGVGESVVSIDSATTAGYTLLAYVDSASTDLKNETNASSSSTIKMLETTYSQALTDNTWGIAITEPNSEEDTIFRGLPTTEKEAMVLKTTNEATDAGDESTFYYGTYITPDLDYGTYSGVTITYVAVANVDSDVVTVNYLTWNSSIQNYNSNTVTYGAKPRIAYLYNGCSTEYLGETQVVKTDNLDDNGMMITSAAVPQGHSDFQYVTFDGADYLRIELTYGFVTDAFVGIYMSSNPDFENSNADFFGSYGNGGAWEYDAETTTVTFILDSNTVGFDPYRYVGIHSGSYGFFARVTPVYITRPSDAKVTEYENCHIVKSDNVDDAGNKVANYDSAVYYTNDIIFIPNADRMVVDVKYGFVNYNTHFALGKGILPYAEKRSAEYYYSESRIFSNESSFYLSGGSATINFELEGDIEDYNETYGYYIQAYPIYYEEHENSMPILVYDAFRKSGTYYSPEFNDWAYSPDEALYVRNKCLEEESVIEYIGNYFDVLRGRTIDLEEIHYMQ